MDFALIGAAGFVAPRHLRAIADNGHRLVAALDPNDSVGVLDQFFADARFFVEFERFERHLSDLRRQQRGVSYVSICSPNYLHDAHIRFALSQGAHAICEKPLVLDPRDLDVLSELERAYGRKVFTVLQLRLHPAVRALHEQLSQAAGPRAEVDLTYITSRGHWYHSSWKADRRKSGGIAANIGIHFFDMLLWIFGSVRESVLHVRTDSTASGCLELERARVRWFLSIDANTLPSEVAARGQRTFRSIRVAGREVEFSEGFTDLHSATYRDILGGGGFGISDARPSVELAHQIGMAHVESSTERAHPFLSA